jgi:hypothetical protein
VRPASLRRGTAALAIALVALVPVSGARTAPVSADDPDRLGLGAFSALPRIGAEGTAPQPAVAAPRPRLRSVASAPLRPRVDDGLPTVPELPAADLVTRRPRLRVDHLADGDPLGATLALPGVAFATQLKSAWFTVGRDRAASTLRVAFVDPDGFRLFTPRFTAESQSLWWRLAQGEVAVTHEAARRLGVQPGQWIPIGPDGRLVKVGALISTGRAQVGDVIMSAWRLGDLAPQDSVRSLLVALQRAGDAGVVAERIAAAGIGTVSTVADIEPYRAWVAGDDAATVAAFEPFVFMPGNGGRIVIDAGWVERNIVTAEVPLYGEVRCHRLIIEPMRAALEEIVAEGLHPLLDLSDYGGCYLPRYIDWQEGRNLSMHAWGLAFDVNVATNGLGQVPQLDMRIVEIFERHGFNWGGWWRRPDGMHFELGSLSSAG